MKLIADPDPEYGLVKNCRLIEFPTVREQGVQIALPLGTGNGLPFRVRRIYYMYDIPVHKSRGGHAHKNLHQIVVALRGRFCIKLGDGYSQQSFTLDNPTTGLYIMPGIWREVLEFTPFAVCMVLASEVYEENDYIRDYANFLSYKHYRQYLIPPQDQAGKLISTPQKMNPPVYEYSGKDNVFEGNRN